MDNARIYLFLGALICLWAVCGVLEYRAEGLRRERLLGAVSSEQVAREGKTDKTYQAKNPLPLSATSTRAKDHAAQTKAQEANGECKPHQ